MDTTVKYEGAARTRPLNLSHWVAFVEEPSLNLAFVVVIGVQFQVPLLSELWMADRMALGVEPLPHYIGLYSRGR